jgi:gentisate 1,2-dioxygenase
MQRQTRGETEKKGRGSWKKERGSGYGKWRKIHHLMVENPPVCGRKSTIQWRKIHQLVVEIPPHVAKATLSKLLISKAL